MSNSDNIKKYLKKVIESSAPQIFILRGQWGVGKTHLWTKFIENHLKDGEEISRKYAYVSLFGLDSLDDFKLQISLNTSINTEPRKLDKLTGYFPNISSAINKLLSSLSNLPIQIPFEKIVTLHQKDLIVCIDDLERRGKNLNLKDVLGYANFLKVERNCHVVLICNDGVGGMDELSEYSEKLTDRSILYEPTPEEVLEIGFKDVPEKYADNLKTVAKKLEIRNIRTLFKINKYVNDLLELERVSKFESALPLVLQALSLLVWSYYESSADNAIPPNQFFIDSYGDIILDDPTNIGEDRQLEEELHESWRLRLNGVWITGQKNLDKELANFVKNGFVFDVQKLLMMIEELNIKQYKHSAEEYFYQRFYPYHYSFQDNQVALVEGIRTVFSDHGAYIRPEYLNQTINLLKGLNENETASQLISKYIRNRQDNRLEIEMPRSMFTSIDSELREKFQSVIDADKQNQLDVDLPVFAESFVNQRSSTIEDERFLKQISKEELVNYFMNKNYDNSDIRTSFIQKALELDRFLNSTDDHKNITNTFKSALCEVAKKSEINNLRVKKLYEINCESLENATK